MKEMNLRINLINQRMNWNKRNKLIVDQMNWLVWINMNQ